MKTAQRASPAVSDAEVIVIIDKIVDHYWREEQRNYLESPTDVENPHIFWHLQELDRYRCGLYERVHQRKRPK